MRRQSSRKPSKPVLSYRQDIQVCFERARSAVKKAMVVRKKFRKKSRFESAEGEKDRKGNRRRDPGSRLSWVLAMSGKV
jgi:hypothetical protein